jgi:hypothetical protein
MCGLAMEISYVRELTSSCLLKEETQTVSEETTIMDSIRNSPLAYVTVKGKDFLIICHAGTKGEQRYSFTCC